MDGKPRIGITCSALRVAGYYDAYLQAISSAGAEPVVIAPVADGPDAIEAERILRDVDGLLVPGGWDVAPEEYGGESVSDVVQVDHALDKTELALVRGASLSGTPVLGICRGQQLINVALGGSLFQHIDGHDAHGQPRHTLAHAVEVEEDSELGRVAPRTLMVNSLHHQAIKDLAPALRVTAHSPDDIIEAVESIDGAIVAVQAHPEELIDYSWARDLFERFVQRSAARARNGATTTTR
ncbi:MAG: gamma-glutamyl-gamma-aminobutyrate hydrolase family protein [Candidatus Dormibacteraeota bacterium]|nr:gamma-glutamyl-gamma-aminobutyrate hydrolase family protein [Candidatus Dormibacteraeota bacterium]